MRNNTAAITSDPLDNEVLFVERSHNFQVQLVAHNNSLSEPYTGSSYHANGTDSRGHDWQEVNGGWRNSDEQMDVPLLLNTEDESFGNDVVDSNHCHSSARNGDDRHPHAKKQLLIALVTCLLFMIAEIIGGYMANSTAIVTDAAHMMSDFTGFLVSLLAVWISQRPASTRMSFGYYRAEILGALLSVVIIWIVTAVLVCIAVDRIIHRDFDIEADIMMIVSAVGVVMNIIIGVVLHGGCFKVPHHGHSHLMSHGHSHADASSHGHSHSQRNVNVRAAMIHVVGDLIQSIGVLIAAVLIKFRPDWGIADPICTFVFSGLVLFTTVGIVRDAVVVLMEGVPHNISYRAVYNDLNALFGVKDVHSLNLWSLSTDRVAVAVHVAIDPCMASDQVLRSATRLLQTKYAITHCTVQVEPYNAAAAQHCLQCLPLTD